MTPSEALREAADWVEGPSLNEIPLWGNWVYVARRPSKKMRIIHETCVDLAAGIRRRADELEGQGL